MALQMNQSVSQALYALCGTIKPYHDKYYSYAFAADTMRLSKFVKYIKHRSHKKGCHWKDICFLLNKYIPLDHVPATPEYPVEPGLSVPAILDAMMEDEATCRAAVNQVLGLARGVHEDQVIFFLEAMVKNYHKHELKIAKLRIWWDNVGGDLYEWEKKV